MQTEKKKGPLHLPHLGAPVAPVKSSSERNELALQVLHKSGVTPEHIETRTLYNDDCPGIPQVIVKYAFLHPHFLETGLQDEAVS